MSTRELRELASKATPGPWTAENRRKFSVVMDGEEREYDAYLLAADERGTASLVLAMEGYPDAAFIAAANPETVLALLDVAEAAKQYMDYLEADGYVPADADLRALDMILHDALARLEARSAVASAEGRRAE